MLYAAIRKSGNVAYGLMQLLWISIHLGRLGIILEMCHRCERENQVTFNLVFRLLTAPIREETKKEVNYILTKVEV